MSGIPQYRCRVGHAFSGDSLYVEQRASLQTALWAALRALEESADLASRLVDRSTWRGNALAAETCGRDAAVYLERAEVRVCPRSS